MQLRVLYVSASSKLGGAERSLLELVRALDRGRVRPIVALPGAGPLEAVLESAGVDVFRLPAVRLRRRTDPRRALAMGAAVSASALTLARRARSRGADLIHSNSTYAHVIGAPAAALTGLPGVWHVRDLHELPVLKRVLLPLTRSVVFVSRAVERAVRLPARPASISRVILNAIDAEAFERSASPGNARYRLGLPPDVPLLVMAAQMVPWKGHSTLIRAAALLRARWPSLALAVAGEDLSGEHPGYEPSLRELVAELGLQGAVHFLGQREDVAGLMADGDVVVVPSEGEPFGRVALEAMALGRPVVATAGGGLAEVVEDGVTGLLVPQRDPPALAAAVDRLLSDRGLARAMGQAGRRRVRQRFDAHAHAREIVRLYDDLLSGRAPGR